MMTSSLKLEVGKTYRQRNDRVVGPLVKGDNKHYPFEIKDAKLATDSWLENGRVWNAHECGHDLVEEVCALSEPEQAYAPTPHLVSAARRPGGGVVLFTDGKIAFEITDAHATHLIARIAQAIVS